MQIGRKNDEPGIAPEQAPRWAQRILRWVYRAGPVLFTLVAAAPLLRRLRHPTLQSDDIMRLVDLIETPFRQLFFLPFAEHVAPLFQLVSWITWEAIGHDLRLAPFAYCLATVSAWAMTLVLLGVWLVRETGSRTAAFVAVALVSQSPLVRETSSWFSSSSFSWAISGILIAVLGAGGLARRRGSLGLIVLGVALAAAGTSLGILAAPLAMLRALVEPGVSRRLKLAAALAAIAGLAAYFQICNLGAIESASAARMRHVPNLEPWGGIGYAIRVPGQMLWPSTFGVPASWLAGPHWPVLVWGAGFLLLAATLWRVSVRPPGGNRKLVVVGRRHDLLRLPAHLPTARPPASHWILGTSFSCSITSGRGITICHSWGSQRFSRRCSPPGRSSALATRAAGGLHSPGRSLG